MASVSLSDEITRRLADLADHVGDHFEHLLDAIVSDVIAIADVTAGSRSNGTLPALLLPLIVIVDLQHDQISYINHACARYLGQPHNKTSCPVGLSTWAQHLHPADRTDWLVRLHDWTQPTTDLMRLAEFRLRGADGIWRRFAGREIVLSRHPGARPRHLLVSLHSLADASPPAAAGVTPPDPAFDVLFAHVTQGIGLVLPGGQITRVNQALASLLNYAPAELTGQSLALVIHPDDLSPILRQLAHLFAGQREHFTEIVRSRRADGSVLWVQVDGRLLPAAADRPEQAVFSVEDITDRFNAERNQHRIDQLSADLQAERDRHVIKTNLLAMLSHDVRTPLATILTSSELIARYAEQMTASDQRERLKRIGEQVRLITRLLDDIDFLNHTNALVSQPDPVAVDLPTQLDHIIADMRLTYPTNNISATLVVSGTPQPYLLNDRLVYQIFANLIANAFKYGRVNGTLTVTCHCEPTGVTVTIADDGLGIPPADQARLFEFFFRGSNTRHITGTGLGLAIVRQAVDWLGGRIDLASEVGVGTTFTIWLPARYHRES